MLHKTIGLASLLTVVALSACDKASTPTAPQSAPDESAVALRAGGSITQALTGSLLNGGTFAGALNITRFAVQNGQLVAIGTLTGTLKNALGTVLGTVTNLPVTIPVAATGTCEILHLDLGPLDLNLLGLMVHLNEVVLDISAQSGSGNLLGNLLCAVAHLLDGGSPLNGLAGLLNNILGAINL
jgi:hypothetical protein